MMDALSRLSINLRASKVLIWLSLVLAITGRCCFCTSTKETPKSNILILSPYTMPSHSNFIRPVVKELASRGHTVTFWNGLEPAIKDPLLKSNLRQLYSPSLGELNSDQKVSFATRHQQFSLFFSMYERTVNVCKIIYEDHIFHQLMTTDEQFDLVIVEGFLNECVLPLVHKFEAPLIYLLGISPPPWILDAIGSPLATAYFPYPGFNFTDPTSFWQRTLNTLSGIVGIYFRNWLLMPTVDTLAARMLTNTSLPSARTIEKESLSIILTNTHFSINHHLPMTSNVIEVGGLHCIPSKPLPKVLYTIAFEFLSCINFSIEITGLNQGLG